MKIILKILSLTVLTIWSAAVWASYFNLKDNQIPLDYELSEKFWQWEAQGQLNLIDNVLDVPIDNDLLVMANTLIKLQNKAYNVDIIAPKIIFMALRGEANGLYVPEDKTIYLNTKMDWNELPIERFAEVVLHENMHHILTHSGIESDDFKYLSAVGFHHHTLAMDHKTLNPQEYVAYQAQRAGRYVGLSQQNLSTWEISALMQEIRVIQKEAYN